MQVVIDRIDVNAGSRDLHVALPWWPLAALSFYGLLIYFILLLPWMPQDQRLWMSTWSTLPAQAAVIVCGIFLTRSSKLSSLRRLGWICVIASLTLNFLGVASWAASWTAHGDGGSSSDDLLYLLAYPPLAMLGLLCFLRDLAAPVWRPGTLLDALALTLAIAAATWGFVIMPTAGASGETVTLIQAVFRHAGLIFPAVLAGIVYTHVRDWRADAGLVALLVASLLNLAGDLMWAGRTIPDQLGEALRFVPIYLLADVTCVLALILEGRQVARTHRRRGRVAYSLLPPIVILTCVIALILAGRPLNSSAARVSIGLLIAATLVLAVREWYARRDIRSLEDERDSARALIDHEIRDRGMLFDVVHEGIAQELAGIRMMLSATRHDEAGSAKAVDAVVTLLDGTISSARRVAEGLAPLRSASGSLPHALQLLGDAANTADFSVVIDADDLDPALTPAQAGVVYRVVQGLLDAARQGGTVHELSMRVVSIDEGQCIEADAAASVGPLMLSSSGAAWQVLEDRIRVAKGSVALQSQPRGWRVSIMLPPENVAG